MRDCQKVILQSSDFVIWYRKNNKSASLDSLLNCKTTLITNNFFLAEELVDLKSQYNIAYVSRKISFEKSKDRLIKENMSVNKAEPLALIENEDIFKHENELESTAFKLETYIKHFDAVANDIMQRISILKKEQNNSNI